MTKAARTSARVCVLPRLHGVGGPASFRARLSDGLTARGVTLVDDPRDPALDAILMIGGTSRITDLLAAKRNGVRIVQRLNGMNWIHRKRFTGVRHYLKSEWNNRLLTLIRGRIADHIVYQSQFARTWWQTVHGSTRAGHEVIYNGVDLNAFSPEGPGERPVDLIRLLLVEAVFLGFFTNWYFSRYFLLWRRMLFWEMVSWITGLSALILLGGLGYDHWKKQRLKAKENADSAGNMR